MAHGSMSDYLEGLDEHHVLPPMIAQVRALDEGFLVIGGKAKSWAWEPAGGLPGQRSRAARGAEALVLAPLFVYCATVEEVQQALAQAIAEHRRVVGPKLKPVDDGERQEP